MSKPKLGVHSEAGKLHKVMVCSPGLAHLRLTPGNCDELLFDDVIWVSQAKRDHFDLISKMQDRGVEGWRVVLVDRARPAGQDHRLRPHMARGEQRALRHRDPRVDAELAHAARDELAVLGAEVDDQHAAGGSVLGSAHASPL